MEGKVSERDRDVLTYFPGIRERGFNAFGHWSSHCMCMSAIVSLHVEHMPGYCQGKPQTKGLSFPNSREKTGLSFPNKAAAISALHTLSDMNFARAQFELGLAYSVGNGVLQNHGMAVAQLEKAAIQSGESSLFSHTLSSFSHTLSSFS
jgi:hypothetical protein